jgi:ferritin-like metal-binding protein YciE
MEDLFVEQLRDLHSAANQILKALPKVIKGAHAPELQQAFQHHLDQTQAQTERLEQILKKHEARTRGRKCKAMEGLLEEEAEILKSDGDDDVLDAALIAAAQRVEHYEIAGYGCARTFARHLSDEMAVNLLEQSLEEERMTDEQLTRIAEQSVNRKAAAASMATAGAIGG